MSETHCPVLLNEVIEGLAIKANGIYVDATFGRGGHSKAILDRLDEQGKLVAIDKDPAAVAHSQQHFGDDPRFSIYQQSFAELTPLFAEKGLLGGVDGLLLDLGVSSPQLDQAERGFSFMQDGPLDMRMDPSQGKSVASWIADVKVGELADVFYQYGEERYARRIAKAVVEEREQQPIVRTGRLAEIITKANPRWEESKHPATRCFQALRIFINDELAELTTSLQQSLEGLNAGGRLCVISFHSLEDRIVKRFIRGEAKGDNHPAKMPVTQEQLNPRLKQIGKRIKSGKEEVMANPRARSAVLRIAEKLI